MGSRLSTQPSHGYCPAQVPPFAEVMYLYLTTVRLTGRVYSKLQDYLLAVVVSLKNYAAPLLYMSDKKVNTAVLVYLTSVVNSKGRRGLRRFGYLLLFWIRGDEMRYFSRYFPVFQKRIPVFCFCISRYSTRSSDGICIGIVSACCR